MQNKRSGLFFVYLRRRFAERSKFIFARPFINILIDKHRAAFLNVDGDFAVVNRISFTREIIGKQVAVFHRQTRYVYLYGSVFVPRVHYRYDFFVAFPPCESQHSAVFGQFKVFYRAVLINAGKILP